MSRRSSLLATAVLGLVSSGLIAPAGASAAEPVSRIVLVDPAGDVWSIGEGENAEWVSAGDLPAADVRRAVVRHGRNRVVVKMTFTDLRRAEPQFYWATIASRRQFGALLVSTGLGRFKGRHQLVNGNFADVKCPRLSHRIDYAADRVTMSVPRSCLGRPRWVRVDLTNAMFRGETEADFQEITDNPHSTGAQGRLTQRLYRAAR